MGIGISDVRATLVVAGVMGGGAFALTCFPPIGNDVSNGYPPGGPLEASDWKTAAALGTFGAFAGIGMGLVGAVGANVPRSALTGAMLLGSIGCAALGVGAALGLGMRD